MKLLEEKIGWLLRFSVDIDIQNCREHFLILFLSHGEIKAIDFLRESKEGIFLFKEDAKEALIKPKMK
jgi:hypothetical protein